MAPAAPIASPADLKASYSSLGSDKVFSHHLTTRATFDKVSKNNESAPFTQAKTAYLSELRSSVKTMQGDINVFLTAKMEEDKKNATTNGQLDAKRGKDEVEEENYGEEDVEEG